MFNFIKNYVRILLLTRNSFEDLHFDILLLSGIFPRIAEYRWLLSSIGDRECSYFQQCSQNVDVNGPHHRCFELIVSSSFNQPMAVERGRSHELLESMVGAVYVYVLRTLIFSYIITATAAPSALCDTIIFRSVSTYCEEMLATEQHMG